MNFVCGRDRITIESVSRVLVAELVSCNCVLSADIAATDLPSKPPVSGRAETDVLGGFSWDLAVESRLLSAP